MLPQRPPLHSMNSSNNNNGQQQQQSVQPPPIPPRSTTRRPRRQRYNTVAVSEEDEDDDHHNVHTTSGTNEYNVVDIERASVVTTIIDDDDDDDNNNNTSRNRNHHRTQRQPLYAALPTSTSSSSSTIILMDVTILDFTHKRWPIQITTDNIVTTTTTVNNSSNSNNGTTQYEPTVYDLKHIGATVHNIPIVQQRLIYQGKLLNDDSVSLISLGIQKSGSIVHLFPKPRVVVVDTSNNNNNNNSANSSNTNETPATNTTSTNSNNSNEQDNNNEGNGGGAHVPVIVMEQSEVDRRSEILVLGHADYVEAVSNVKLFSLMLLIISTIELLHLLSLYITPPQSGSSNSNSYYNSNSYNGDGPNNAPRVHEDDTFFNDDQYNGTSSASKNSSNVIDTITAGANAIDPIEMILDQWTPIKYVDLIISIFGIYVSILGMRASNENCIRTARHYLIGTTLTAIAWLAYNYIISYEIDVEVDAHPEKYYENSESSDYNYGSSATTNDDVIGETYSSNNSNGSNSGYYNSNDSPYNQAFSAMILPGMVWGLCIYRAWQFQHVLYDAELEAAERTNTMMSIDETHDTNNNNNNSGMNQTLGDVELSAMSILRRHHNNTTGSNNNSDDTTDGNSTNPSPTVRMIT